MKPVLLIFALFLAASCRPGELRAGERIDLLVIAPHPDDEVLIAGGRISQTIARGGRVAVILVTNGDYTCERDGYQREAESIAALTFLGVKQSDVHFLGYPDGALRKLSSTPLGPVEFRDATGECIARTSTWADRTAGRIDEHTQRTGKPAEWTSDAIVGDLAALLQRLQPVEVALPHGIDDHPDHAMTYVYFRRALDTLKTAPMIVHRGVVHAGPCWPSTCQTYFTPDAVMPPLPSPLFAYLPSERLEIDAQQKLAMIAFYRSQTESDDATTNWLSSFARKDEITFPERYERRVDRWVQVGSHSRDANTRVLDTGDGFVEFNRWSPEGLFMESEVRPLSSSQSTSQ
ncbi:MAG: PIG-L family deacetylase [Archangium sp.]